MKKVFLTLVLSLTLLITGQNFALAQDPNDPGFPDTVWISQVPMSETVNPLGWPKQFAVKCSVFTDEYLGGFTIPVSFYNSENLNILIDSMVISDWVTQANPSMISLNFHNDSVAHPDYTPKCFYGGAVWFSGGLPPGPGVLFTIYFNGDFFEVMNWDTSKGIVLDMVHFFPGDAHFKLYTTSATGFTPVSCYGLIGGGVSLKGTVYKHDGVTPDSGASVFFRGKDITYPPPEGDTISTYLGGRSGEVRTDAYGNYEIVVGKDADCCVFRDTSGLMVEDVNAYCFNGLTADVSDIDFHGKYPPGQGVIISGISYRTAPTPWKKQKINLSGSIDDTVRTNSLGYYEFDVLKGGNYCVWIDTSTKMDSTNSYCFSLLGVDTLNNDFENKKIGGWIFISGTVYQTPLQVWPGQKVYLSGQIKSGLDIDDSTISDNEGNYEFRVVKRGTEYCVCMDSPGCPNPATSYCFNYLLFNSFHNDFIAPGIRARVTISGLVCHYNGEPWKDAPVYLIGSDLSDKVFRKDTIFTDSFGNYEFDVLLGLKYCVFIDTTGGMNPTNSYCFDSLVTDTTGNNFIKHPVVNVEEESKEALPKDFALFQNYPNPFNPYTLIRFALPEDCEVKLEVYNILGQKIKTLRDGFFNKGVREVVWDGRNQKGKEVASGIYFYRIKTEKYTDIKKMILLR